MFRYAITSRALYPGNEDHRQAALLAQTAQWVADGIDFIQLREKDLPTGTLGEISRNIIKTIALASSPTKLLISSRLDVAVATSAHGVHLTSSPGELTPAQVRQLYASASLPAPLITVSCHTLHEAGHARDHHVDAILFAPVFEKQTSTKTIPGRGLEALHATCLAAAPTPVYALGGVTLENALACLKAGAAGIAGIRLFQTL